MRSPDATVFTFMRHAEAISNLSGTVTSASPGLGLSPLGAQQATAAAERVDLGSDGRVAVSPLLRARETATLVAAPAGAPIVVDERLREFEVGSLEGRTDDEAREQLWAAWVLWLDEGDLDHRPAPGAESGAEAVARIADFLRDWSGEGGRTVLVVSHGTVLQLALTVLCENIPTRNAPERWISHTATVSTTFDGEVLSSTRWRSNHKLEAVHHDD